MRGYPVQRRSSVSLAIPLDLLLCVGALFQIDIENFKLHPRFWDPKDYFSLPHLHSSFYNIIRLRSTTVGLREKKQGVCRQTKFEELRKEASKSKHIYEHNLLNAKDIKRGDSIDRGFHVLDEKHFLVEQEITVCLTQSANSWAGWSELVLASPCTQLRPFLVLILTDVGNDLSQGPDGPWVAKHDREAAIPWTVFYPVVSPRPRNALVPKASNTTEKFNRSRRYP